MGSVAGMESQFMIIVLLAWNIGLTIAVIALAQKVKAQPGGKPDIKSEE